MSCSLAWREGGGGGRWSTVGYSQFSRLCDWEGPEATPCLGCELILLPVLSMGQLHAQYLPCPTGNHVPASWLKCHWATQLQFVPSPSGQMGLEGTLTIGGAMQCSQCVAALLTLPKQSVLVSVVKRGASASLPRPRTLAVVIFFLNSR